MHNATTNKLSLVSFKNRICYHLKLNTPRITGFDRSENIKKRRLAYFP